MSALEKRKGPQIDLFIQCSDGHFIPFNQFETQLEKLKKQKSNCEQQIETNEKLIQNSNRKIGFLCASSLCYMAALGALVFSSNTKVKAVATLCGLSTVAFDAVSTTIFNRREKNLKQQQAYLKQQERSIS